MTRFVESACRSFAHGVRWLTRRPLSSLSECLCLGVGIGACAAAWTLIDAAILRPFGLPASQRLLVIWETDPAHQRDLIEVSHLNFLDWQRETRTLESMAAFGSSHWPAMARIDHETVSLATRGVSTTFFATLGISPALGRDFATADLQPDASPPVMLSHRLWQTRFAASPGIVGQPLFINGEDYRILGVMPRGFGYPDDPDAWLSVERELASAFASMPLDQQRAVGVLEVLARRRPEASHDEVRAEISGIIRNLRARHDPSEQTVAASVNAFSDVLLGRLGSRLWIALGMAGIVMLFACANVASVRLAQARERAGELTARLFLGASRTRLATDLAIEAMPLVMVATLVATATWMGVTALLSDASIIAQSGLELSEARGSAVVVVGVLGALSWAFVGLLPALTTARRVVVGPPLPLSRLSTRTQAVGAPLIFGQAALAIAVVAVAGTALQAFDRLSRTDVGFSTGVTLVDVGVPGWKYESTAAGRALFDRLQQALRELPGVDAVGAVSVRPFRFGEIVDGLPVRRSEDSTVQTDDAIGASRVVVTPDYFNALGQPIVEGREFSDFDRSNTVPVVVVSQTLARALWGDVSALGRRVDTFSLSEKWRSRTVIGIAGDARYRGLERPSMELYIPHTQATTPLGSLVVAAPGSSAISEAVVRQALRRVEPELAIERLQTTTDLVQTVLSPARLLATLMTWLGAAGLLLLTLGIFGAAATALRAALPEIAVRQAVGALPLQAVRAPLGTLARALTTGMVAGLMVTPVALSAAEALGLAAGEALAGPLVTGTVAVLLAAAIAIGPSMWRASTASPADLLRER